MKKVLKIIGIALLAIIILLVVLLFIASRRPAVAGNYTETVQTGGSLEAKYLAMGAHQTANRTMAAMSSFKSYDIWYPADMAEKTPVVIFCNGTGVPASKYPALLKHLASWGFIAIGTEEEHSWYGFSAELCFRLVERLNKMQEVEGWEDNPFCGKVDLDNVGVSGHSQGGVGVINAITDTQHAGRYKAAYSASPTNKELAHTLMWDYDAGKVDIPILLVSSTGNGDENLVVSGEQLQEIYEDIPGVAFKAMARRNGADHGDVLYFADGYMTAFFLWQLQGDQGAAGAFCGEGAELLTNGLYQDQAIDA